MNPAELTQEQYRHYFRMIYSQGRPRFILSRNVDHKPYIFDAQSRLYHYPTKDMDINQVTLWSGLLNEDYALYLMELEKYIMNLPDYFIPTHAMLHVAGTGNRIPDEVWAKDLKERLDESTYRA